MPTLGPGLHLPYCALAALGVRAYTWPGPTYALAALGVRAYTWPGPTLGAGLHYTRIWPGPTLARAYAWLGPTLYSVLARAYITSLLWLGPKAHPWHGSL